jgi:hypothetical protein
MNSAILDESDSYNQIFKKFKEFVNKMLLFYSLRENMFIGFKNVSGTVDEEIIKANKVKDFEDFLRKASNINLELVVMDGPERKSLGVKYEAGPVSYFNVASTGMISLILFYSWLISLKECSFVFIDEFDAFYHYELAESIIKELKEIKGVQIFTTTHNTDLMSNDLLRPDCYFVLTDEKIESFNRLIDKDLRFAHNLQKMFKAHAFDNN